MNLRYGVKHDMSRTGSERDTCTACAGSMLLEFSALSRLTGNTVFEVGISTSSILQFAGLFAVLGQYCCHNPATGFRPPSATVVSAESFSHGTGTLRCLQKEMARPR